ncbi:MAG TPA: hypothetical protein VF800_06735, partial [Telluria sp.]
MLFQPWIWSPWLLIVARVSAGGAGHGQFFSTHHFWVFSNLEECTDMNEQGLVLALNDEQI